MSDREPPRPSRVGYLALGMVLAGLPFVLGPGAVLVAGGMFLAFAVVLFDARDGRRVSRPAVVALALGPAVVALLFAVGEFVHGTG